LTWLSSAEGSFGQGFRVLDPDVSYSTPDYSIEQNVYEPLLWYNGNVSTQVIPWLAQDFSLSPDGRIAIFTLRNDIRFADGNPLNSTAVYFSLNRILIEDGSLPSCSPEPLPCHGSQASWIVQKLENYSLSWTLSGPHNYTQGWAQNVLDENFVNITGPLTFKLNIQNPDASFPFILAAVTASILDPQFVMYHDMSLWTQMGYLLPYPILTGSLLNQINQYLKDEVATCDVGATPDGCGTTYLDQSIAGSLAGTGPYIVNSTSGNLNLTVLTANPNYWGGPFQFNGGSKIVPHFQTVNIRFVPAQSDRTDDLMLAGRIGQTMIADIDPINPDNLYGVANSTVWLGQQKLVPIIPNISLHGPYTASYATYFMSFVTNVTNPSTGTFYKFQPFADIRLRLAFADAVDLYSVNQQTNNNLGQVAINAVPPGLPPEGAYNTTLLPRYGYSVSNVKSLLLQAMVQPVTSFRFFNGSTAPTGLFNNTFGCPSLDLQGQCVNPVIQTVSLTYPIGDTVSESIFSSIASTINQISQSYHMGLQVIPQAINQTEFNIESTSRMVYMFPGGWLADYPWVLDVAAGVYAPNLANFPEAGGWNVSQMSTMYEQAQLASVENNVSGVIFADNQLNSLANQQVMYLWTFYPYSFYAMTSNLQGFYYNPSTFGGVNFAMMSLRISVPGSQNAEVLLAISVGTGISSVVAVGTLYFRKSSSIRGKDPKGISNSFGGAVLLESADSIEVGNSSPNPKSGISNVQVSVYCPHEVNVGSEFAVKYDLINTGNTSASVYKLVDMAPYGMRVISTMEKDQNGKMAFLPEIADDNSLYLRGEVLQPSQIESFNFLLVSDKPGERIFSPSVIYSDETAELHSQRSSAVKVLVKPVLEFTFSDSKTKAIFDYLVSAFLLDHISKKLAQENSGWRTQAEIAKEAHLPIYSVYARGGGMGSLMIELKRRGLLEERILSGERGRGGRILKLRILLDNSSIREYVDETIRSGRLGHT
jgi:ABC-type transport system substrate-binding protein